jgi:Uma2 family endonuclease
MTVATLDWHGLGPWSEDEFFQFGETPNRIELIDGSLLVSPAPTKRHQHLSFLLTSVLIDAARAQGLGVFQAVNVRLKTDRIVIPDLVVAETDDDGLVVHASEVRLVCELVSPSNAVADRVTKMRLYAVAGIPWYLLVENDDSGLLLRLFQLQGEHYVLSAEARSGQVLALRDPITVDVAVDRLA